MDKLDYIAFCREKGKRREHCSISASKKLAVLWGKGDTDIYTRKIGYQKIFIYSINKHVFFTHYIPNKGLVSGEDNTEQDRK